MGSRNQAKTQEFLTKSKTTRRRLRRRPKGAALRAAPLGSVVFDLVRISYVLASFPVPILDRFWLNFLAIPRVSSPIVANSGDLGDGKKSLKKLGNKHLAKVLLFLGNAGPSLGNVVVEPQEP